MSQLVFEGKVKSTIFLSPFLTCYSQVVVYSMTFSTLDYSSSSALNSYITGQFAASGGFFAIFPSTFTTVSSNHQQITVEDDMFKVCFSSRDCPLVLVRNYVFFLDKYVVVVIDQTFVCYWNSFQMIHDLPYFCRFVYNCPSFVTHNHISPMHIWVWLAIKFRKCTSCQKQSDQNMLRLSHT